MRVEDLRNYGRGLIDSVPDPGAPERRAGMRGAMRAELLRELGSAGLEDLARRAKGEARRMRARDWSILRSRGLRDGGFVGGIIFRIAGIKALADMVGAARASKIQCRLVERTAYDLMAPMFTSMEDYRACGDYFEAFKAYTRASNAANVRAGIHEIVTVADTPREFAFDVGYCAWHEVAKAFGDPYLCYPSTCYVDEVFIPRALAGSGCRFKREGTLATGAAACDFRFEYPGDG